MNLSLNSLDQNITEESIIDKKITEENITDAIEELSSENEEFHDFTRKKL